MYKNWKKKGKIIRYYSRVEEASKVKSNVGPSRKRSHLLTMVGTGTYL